MAMETVLFLKKRMSILKIKMIIGPETPRNELPIKLIHQKG